MKFKVFFGLYLFIMPLSVSAVDDDLLVYKANKEEIYSNFYGESIISSVYLFEGFASLSVSINGVYFDAENSTGSLVFNVLVNSNDNDFLYSNNFNARVLLSEINIDWARGTFHLSNDDVVDVMPLSQFQLRHKIDQSIATSIVIPHINQVLDKKSFKIPKNIFRSMNEQAKYYIKSNKGNVYISL